MVSFDLSKWISGSFWGLSGWWWTRTHTKHHAMPQRLEHDQDLETLPFLLYNSKIAKDPKQANSFFVLNQVLQKYMLFLNLGFNSIYFLCNQSWLYLTFHCAMCNLIWVINSCPMFMIKQRDYFGFAVTAIHWGLNYIMIPDLPSLIFIFWMRSTYIIGNFALAHSHRPVTGEPTHWVEYALTHTANIHPSLIVDWWTGYLNLHIEHHLFPTMPEFRLHMVQDRVKALAEKHGLPYEIDYYFESWNKTIQNFKKVAEEIRSST